MGNEETLSGYLSMLRARQGGPTLRKMASELSFSYKTVQEMLNGTHVGAWDKVLELALSLHGDEAVTRGLWEAAKDELARDRAAKTAVFSERKLRAHEETNRLLAVQVGLLEQILERLPQSSSVATGCGAHE